MYCDSYFIVRECLGNSFYYIFLFHFQEIFPVPGDLGASQPFSHWTKQGWSTVIPRFCSALPTLFKGVQQQQPFPPSLWSLLSRPQAEVLFKLPVLRLTTSTTKVKTEWLRVTDQRALAISGELK